MGHGLRDVSRLQSVEMACVWCTSIKKQLRCDKIQNPDIRQDKNVDPVEDIIYKRQQGKDEHKFSRCTYNRM
jgi:hypothetical protein